jgi:hypothetical protein
MPYVIAFKMIFYNKALIALSEEILENLKYKKAFLFQL